MGYALRLGFLILCAGVWLQALPAQAQPLLRTQSRLPKGPTGWRQSARGGIRGITVGPIESSQWPGRGYGTPHSAELLDELVRMGVSWVSVTPFGRLWSLQSTDILMDFEAPFEKNRADILRFMDQAHARGIRVLLIPHLWIETEGWRGEIEPGSAAGWAAYQRSYREFVLEWAQVAAEGHAEMFSIGVECKSWSGRFGPYWSSLIGDVRDRFDGLLTYSANWDEVETVLFWRELDLIGINAFYPLADHAGATYDEYVQGAARARQGVEQAAELHQRPVVFVEVGYTTRQDAAVEPWLWPDGMTGVVIDQDEQARALAAVFEAFLPEPWFAGFFVWRYYASLDDVSQEAEWGFSPHGKKAADVLRQVFHWRWGSDPDPYRDFP